ncbi:MAG TPA: MFS transporter, partial [Planctomycetaceae bacterium]|nr:MFS transporter [Planctomycetaceae bacterium]
ISGICIGIAVLGTCTSLVVRRTAVANPGAPFDVSGLAIHRATWRLLRGDRALRGVLLISSLFWFVGGVVLPAVNTFGKVQLGLSDSRTSILAACMGVGIAVGCVAAGKLSRGRIESRLVTAGGWGIFACLALVAWLGATSRPLTAAATEQPPQSLAELLALVHTVHPAEWPARWLLTGLGLSAGLFVVPLQVFLQKRPPRAQKGRMIGTMNLVNWIGILLAAGFYFAASAVFTPGRIGWTFAALAAFMLPVAVFYRPPDEPLE